MNEDILDQIRRAAREVTREARFVRLREERLADYAKTLAPGSLPPPVYDTEHHFLGEPADTAAFQLALDSINFGSGYFPHLRKRPGMSGYFTVASSLKDVWEREGAFSGERLRGLRTDDCARMFRQVDNPGPALELMSLFAQALNDLGEWLGANYDDDPLEPIAAADGSAARLVELVAAMPLYRDVAEYHGREVPIYKRAQILIADLTLAFNGAGPGAFHDLDRLTIFADNLVPHVLQVDGLLAYDGDLLSRINRGELIPAGSPEEVEIRVVTIHAVERLVETLREAGIETSARELDYLLWNRGLEDTYKSIPRHRTRTVYY
ncbi:MAG: queuosine salvage family protein [Thermomicrobiales bacterium]